MKANIHVKNLTPKNIKQVYKMETIHRIRAIDSIFDLCSQNALKHYGFLN